MTSTLATTVMQGAVAMASLIATLFFIRFWQQTHDRFFLLFAGAFAIDAVSRTLVGLHAIAGEQEVWAYAARLLMFGLIVIAIIDKNRGTDPP